MLKYFFFSLLIITSLHANASDWDKVERATEKALDDVEDAVNEVDDDVEAFLEKPETKAFFKRVKRNSKRVVRSIGEGFRHFADEVKEEIQDKDAPAAETLAPVVITTKNLTLLRGIENFETLSKTLRPGAYYFSMNGESFKQIIPLQPGTSLKVVPTSAEDNQFATDSVNSLNAQGEAQYCVDTSTFEIVDTAEVVAVHIFSECTVTAE